MIFFFCGHGVSSGPITSLLLEDFGESHDSPFLKAIDFRKFYLGMDKCTARKQCFFIDACRVASYTLIETFDYYGHPIITADRVIKPREAPVFHSAGLGEQAYSRPNSASIFTEALIKALNGAGVGARPPWQVFTSWLHTALTEFMPYLYHDRVQQSCRATENCRLLIHQIKGNPIIPVIVSCDPGAATSSAQLSYSYTDGTNRIHRSNKAKSSKPAEWIIEIEPGRYKFNAEFDAGPYASNSKSEQVMPPITLVSIKV